MPVTALAGERLILCSVSQRTAPRLPLTPCDGPFYSHAMASELQLRVARAMLTVIRPLARTVLRHGISFREFDQLARRAFVQAATADYGIRGRPTNISRVAAMTGLSRKEIRRIRNTPDAEAGLPVAKRNRAAELLHLWHTDPEYLSESGEPEVLPYSGEAPSFTGLVKQVGGDLPPGALRAALLQARAVERLPDGSLRAVKRYFIPFDVDSRLLEGLRFGLRSLTTTVLYNANPANRAHPKFQRIVAGRQVPARMVPVVREKLRQMLTDASARLDDYLSGVECTVPPKARHRRMTRVAAGLYYFEDRKPQTGDFMSPG